jgi:CubicO group peptidase (beta-lactamase class C family)
MLLWLMACGEESKGEPEVETPAVLDVSAQIQPYLESSGAPALGTARIQGDLMTEMGAGGVRNIEMDTPVELEDKWHLGSCTKAMTASLIATFVEEGVLSWDTTLQEALGDLDYTIHEDYQSVTIAMLLAHTGGTWGSLLEHTNTWQTMNTARPVMDIRQMVAEDVLTEAPEVTPGTTMLYSNAGYIIAGAILEHMTGTSWETLITERIFEALEMNSCGFGPPDVDGEITHPWGHYEGSPLDMDNPPSLGPAGTVHCSMADWGLYIIDALNGVQGEPALLQTTSYTALFADQGHDYGHGWGVVDQDWAGGVAYSHSGSNGLNAATVWIVPELDEAYLMVANSAENDVWNAFNDLVGFWVEYDAE